MSEQKKERILDRGQWLAIGVAVAMLAVFVLVVYVPGERQRKELAAQLSEARQQLGDKLQRTQQLPAYEDRVRAAQAEYLVNVARIPGESRVPEFLGAVTDMMTAVGIEQRDVVPGEPTAGKNHVQQPVTITFEAPFGAAYTVLSRIETMDRIGRIDGLKVATAADAKDDRLRVEMKVSVFYAGSGGRVAQGQAAGGKGARL